MVVHLEYAMSTDRAMMSPIRFNDLTLFTKANLVYVRPSLYWKLVSSSQIIQDVSNLHVTCCKFYPLH